MITLDPGIFILICLTCVCIGIVLCDAYIHPSKDK